MNTLDLRGRKLVKKVRRWDVADAIGHLTLGILLLAIAYFFVVIVPVAASY